jgi:hypothetical protein
VIKDPPVRHDGKCSMPGCGKIRKPPTGKYATRADFEIDPFCSTECARKWHGVVDTRVNGSGKMNRPGTQGMNMIEDE